MKNLDEMFPRILTYLAKKVRFRKIRYDPSPLYSYILVGLFFILMLWMLYSERDNVLNSNSRTELIKRWGYNISNKWHYNFRYLDREVQGRFTAKSDDTQLVYSSYLKEGTIIFQLYNSKDSLLVTIPANNMIDTIIGTFEKGQQYKIRATAIKAKGRFDFKME